MTSDIYVWVWLPGETNPIVMGAVEAHGQSRRFTYGRSYLANPAAIPLYGLPLIPGPQRPPAGPTLHGALRDALPDAWGQRVIAAQLTGRRSRDIDTGDVDLSLYMLHSSSDRFGAIDFQASPEQYLPRGHQATRDDLARAAQLVEEGHPLPPALADAIEQGTTLGGARPKATLSDPSGHWIVKFSSSDDHRPAVRHEALGLDLARLAGVDTVDHSLTRAAGRDALLVRRFDRGPRGARRLTVSGLTLVGLDESVGRYSTYPDLLDALDAHSSALEAGPELFRRIAANIALGNTDDHARNHAAFWDGQHLQLTPAYDIDPCRPAGWDANQAMAYGRDGQRVANLSELLTHAGTYHLARTDAEDIVDRTLTAIHEHWDDACDRARLTRHERAAVLGSRILNPATVEGLPRPVSWGWDAAADDTDLLPEEPPPGQCGAHTLDDTPCRNSAHGCPHHRRR